MLTINDIKTGYSFDYQSQQWRTVEKYFYKWDEDGTISTEFKIQSDNETKYLEIDANENIISISKKIRYGDLSGESGSSTVNFNGTDYTLEKEHSGLYWEENSKWEQEAFNVWDYFDNTQKNWISVEEWDDNEFEVYVGSIIDPNEISNIKEGKPPPKFNLNVSNIIKIMSIGSLLILSLALLFNKNSNPKYIDAYDILDGFKNSDKAAVILNDIKYDETASKKYAHQYKVIYKDQDSFKSKITEFKNVSPSTFLSRKSDMGLEVIHKKSENSLNSISRPPGYGLFVGNTNYGNWTNANTINQDSTWKFKSQYASLNDFYNFNEQPVDHKQWIAYKSLTNSIEVFYGTNNEYSTDAYLQTETGKKSNWGLTPLAKREEALRQAKIDKEQIIARQRQRQIQRTQRNSNRYSRSSSRRSSGGK